jgi:Rps23 Pro-64 3,4-dihydroxylase Tpa1-like proline 4-hydroxylase
MVGYVVGDERVPSADARHSQVDAGADLAPIWHALAADLLSMEYRDAVTTATCIDVREAPMQAHFEVGETGSWYHPHVDKNHRAVSHLFYFNERWDRHWGGSLRILRSRDIDDVIAEIDPIAGVAVLMAHAPALWHGTPAITEPGVVRRSLHVWFWV